MLLPVLPLRDPLEYPPPDPPRAFAKERVGTPIRDNTMVAAISFVLFKVRFLSIDVANQSRTSQYPNSKSLKKTKNSREDGQAVLLLAERAVKDSLGLPTRCVQWRIAC